MLGRTGHNVQHDEKRARHGAHAEKLSRQRRCQQVHSQHTARPRKTHRHGKVRDALLDDPRPDDLHRLPLCARLDPPARLVLGLAHIALKVASLAELRLGGHSLRDAQRLGVHGGLGHEPVRRGEANDAADKGRAPEEEEIPVEPGGALDGEAARLRHDRADVVL